MKHIVFDCDNTFGVKDCDVDDGLALLYLLGCPEAELLGITMTYGNSSLDVVCDATEKMLKEIGREDLPIKRGGDGPGKYESDGADFLVKMANRYAGNLSVLATGSLTNLYGAYQKDPKFFEKVKEIVLMGGITEPLIFDKKEMKELNFSCDPRASYTVLKKGLNVSVVTGNNCLKVLFTKEDYKDRLFSTDNQTAKYIREKTDYWFLYNETDYGIQGFYNWDVTAAVYLMHPELFTDVEMRFAFSEDDLKRGYLKRAEDGKSICDLPKIRKADDFKENIYAAWMNVER